MMLWLNKICVMFLEYSGKKFLCDLNPPYESKKRPDFWLHFCLFPSPNPSNSNKKSLTRKAQARKPRINLRNLQGMRKRSSNGHCINLSALIHYYCNPSVKKPSSGAVVLPATPTDGLRQGVAPSTGTVVAARASPGCCKVQRAITTTLLLCVIPVSRQCMLSLILVTYKKLGT